MVRDRQKEARDRAVGRLEGRPKALRRELSDLESELERARRRRDRAQARVEALEAIAEQLTVALVTAEAARERRRVERDEAATAATWPRDAVPDDASVAVGDARHARGHRARRGRAAQHPEPTTTADQAPVSANESPEGTHGGPSKARPAAHRRDRAATTVPTLS